jgi:hypothetical protein
VSKLTFIPDGYTEPFRLKAVEGLHGELQGTFRRLTAAQRDGVYTFIDQNKQRPTLYNASVAKMLAEQVVTWDAKDDRGQSVPLNAATVARLHPTLYDKLYGIVMSRIPSDPLEAEHAGDDEADPFLQHLATSQEDGKPMPQVQQEADRKNS